MSAGRRPKATFVDKSGRSLTVPALIPSCARAALLSELPTRGGRAPGAEKERTGAVGPYPRLPFSASLRTLNLARGGPARGGRRRGRGREWTVPQPQEGGRRGRRLVRARPRRRLRPPYAPSVPAKSETGRLRRRERCAARQEGRAEPTRRQSRRRRVVVLPPLTRTGPPRSGYIPSRYRSMPFRPPRKGTNGFPKSFATERRPAAAQRSPSPPFVPATGESPEAPVTEGRFSAGGVRHSAVQKHAFALSVPAHGRLLRVDRHRASTPTGRGSAVQRYAFLPCARRRVGDHAHCAPLSLRLFRAQSVFFLILR